MTNFKKIFIADAWPYVNGDPHVGHFAGHLIPADIMSRFSRMRGHDVLMVSGSDCYGTPITVEADKKGIKPMDLVNEYHPKVVDLLAKSRVVYDLYTKTVTQNHTEVVQQLFLDLLNNGYIFKDKQEQYYSEADNKFLPDRYVEGKCNICGFEGARSDQCDNCGNVLQPGDLINPYSKLTKAPVELKQTEHYFLDFPKLQDKVEAYVKSKEGIWRDWVFKESMGWIKTGLQPRAITRDLDWGVELPIDRIPDELKLETFDNKRIYVWIDAVTGYLSASIEWSKIRSDEKWKDFWFDPEVYGYYFMGKDNLFFHTILWPAQLIGASKPGQEYNLPTNVSVNAYLNLEGKKNSKSRGWYLDSNYLFEEYGPDRARFYFGATLPETKDSDFKWDEFQASINNELVGNLGNFIHRTLVFVQNKFGGQLEEFDVDENIKSKISEVFNKTEEKISQTKFVEALNELMSLSKFGNKYFDENKPWALIKEDEQAAQKVLYNCVSIIHNLRILMNVWMPDASERLNKTLGYTDQIEYKKDSNQWQYSKPGKIKLAENILPLFEKIEDEKIQEEKAKLVG